MTSLVVFPGKKNITLHPRNVRYVAKSPIMCIKKWHVSFYNVMINVASKMLCKYQIKESKAAESHREPVNGVRFKQAQVKEFIFKAKM